MRTIDRFLLLPLLQHLIRDPADPGTRMGERSLQELVGGATTQARALVRRCLRPLRSLFGPRATDPEIHVIATASSATTTKSAGTDGSESAAHDARRRSGPRRLIVRLLPAAPATSPQTT